MEDVKFVIEQKIGILSQGDYGWNKEINLISWNNREAKFDIRDWDRQHEKMSKGITLSKEELKMLRDILDLIDI